MSDAAAKMGFIWMGGGHEAFKLGVPVDAFLAVVPDWGGGSSAVWKSNFTARSH